MLSQWFVSMCRPVENAHRPRQVPACAEQGDVLPSWPGSHAVNKGALQPVQRHVFALSGGDLTVNGSPGTVLMCWLVSAGAGTLLSPTGNMLDELPLSLSSTSANQQHRVNQVSLRGTQLRGAHVSMGETV